MEKEELWELLQVENLRLKTQDLNEVEKNRYDVAYLEAAIKRVPMLTKHEADLIQFKTRTEELIDLFPTRQHDGKLKGNPYLKRLLSYKEEIQKKHNLVSKSYYLTIWLPMGIAIGLPFGVIFKNLALGVPIGLAIGISFGMYFDRKAAKENRII